MIDKWNKKIFNEKIDKSKISEEILSIFYSYTPETSLEDWEFLFEKVGIDFNVVLKTMALKNDEDQDYFTFFSEYFEKNIPFKKEIERLKEKMIEFEVWNTMFKQFDKDHDKRLFREELLLRHFYVVADEWKKEKNLRFEDYRSASVAKAEKRRSELISKKEASQLTSDEEKELKYLEEFEMSQETFKTKEMETFIRLNALQKNIQIGEINSGVDKHIFNRPKFISEIENLKSEFVNDLKRAEANFDQKIEEEKVNYSLAIQQKNEELKKIENDFEEKMNEILKQIHLKNEVVNKEKVDTLQEFEKEKERIFKEFEKEQSELSSNFDEKISSKDEEIQKRIEQLSENEEEREKIRQEYNAEIEQFKQRWMLSQNEKSISEIKLLKKKKLIELAREIGVPIPSSKNIVEELRGALIDSVTKLQIRYSEHDLEEILQKRIEEFGKESSNDTSDPFGGGGDMFGSGDPFGGGNDPFGGSSDPFGSNADPFGGGNDPFGGGDMFGSGDPFGGGNDPFGGSSDPFGSGADPFGGGNNPFGGGGDMFGSGDPFGDSDTSQTNSSPSATLPDNWNNFTKKEQKNWLKGLEKLNKMSKKYNSKHEAELEQKHQEQTQIISSKEQELEQKTLKAKEDIKMMFEAELEKNGKSNFKILEEKLEKILDGITK